MDFADFDYRLLSSFENRLISFVAAGELQTALTLLDDFPFCKNELTTETGIYCITLNALLRKTCEMVKVPLEFVKNISQENILYINSSHLGHSIKPIIQKIVTSYCDLVKKYNKSSYSPPIRKAIVKIESDLENDISLNALAEYNNMSSGYFSGLFKKETGVNLTDFINKKRIERAQKLVSLTKLSFKDISKHCGINDVNYFSKLFKKYAGVTPSEYRKKQSEIK